MIAAEPGVRYIDRYSGEQMEVTDRLLPLAPSPSRLPRAEENRPSSYLIDAAGHIRCAHVGEGGYRRTEASIVALLAEAERATMPAEPNPQALRSDQ